MKVKDLSVKIKLLNCMSQDSDCVILSNGMIAVPLLSGFVHFFPNGKRVQSKFLTDEIIWETKRLFGKEKNTQ
jgi:hypothetical protein